MSSATCFESFDLNRNIATLNLNMFSLRSSVCRRVFAGLQIATLGRCLHTKKLGSGCIGPSVCHAYTTRNRYLCRTFTSETTLIKCWKCNKESKSKIFCENCSALHRPHGNVSYFNLFDLEESFDTDPVELSLRYRKLQSLLHPDKFANATDEEKANSAEFSSLINEAYQTLILPLQRGMYLLELKGINTKEDHMTDDKEFLMEVMIRNEELDEAESEVDIKTFHKEVKETLSELVHEVSDAFKQNNISKAHAGLIRMRYFTSILEKVKNKIRERGIIE